MPLLYSRNMSFSTVYLSSKCSRANWTPPLIQVIPAEARFRVREHVVELRAGVRLIFLTRRGADRGVQRRVLDAERRRRCPRLVVVVRFRLPLEVYGDGEQFGDPIYVDDAVDALLLAGGARNLQSRVYNVWSGSTAARRNRRHALPPGRSRSAGLPSFSGGSRQDRHRQFFRRLHPHRAGAGLASHNFHGKWRDQNFSSFSEPICTTISIPPPGIPSAGCEPGAAPGRRPSRHDEQGGTRQHRPRRKRFLVVPGDGEDPVRPSRPDRATSPRP